MNIIAALRRLSVCLPLASCAAAPAAQSSIAPIPAGDIETLRAGFRNPPREAGPWVYWMFFENVMSLDPLRTRPVGRVVLPENAP